jgi:uncharacterized linocin/CFP29 family protein
MADLNWSDAQWQKVYAAVTEAFDKTSVSSALLRRYGPLPGSTETVRNERLQLVAGGPRLTVRVNASHSAVNLRLVNLTVDVELSSEQISDDKLSLAILAFQDAASILALQEDLIVFAGYARGFSNENSPIVVNQVGPQQGLADLPARRQFQGLLFPQGDTTLGQLVVPAVVDAMTVLEGNSHPAPFACVLGNRLFQAVHDPSTALVLPADRVTPMLKGGPLLRSGQIDPQTGIVVSLAGDPVDIVVGTPATVQFLQRQPNATFLFRVYEKFVLRIKDQTRAPVAGFRIQPDSTQVGRETARLLALRS